MAPAVNPTAIKEASTHSAAKLFRNDFEFNCFIICRIPFDHVRTNLRIDVAAPDLTFGFSKRIVRHHDSAHPRDVEHLIDVSGRLRELEKARASSRSAARVSRPKASST